MPAQLAPKGLWVHLCAACDSTPAACLKGPPGAPGTFATSAGFALAGHLGSLLGEHNVNIASMQVGRRIVRGDAVMVLSIDDPIPPALLATINGINGIQEAHPVTL